MIFASLRADARTAPRLIVRLRTGKLADLEGRLIAECRIIDRSWSGMRLQLSPTAHVPDDLLFFEDETAALVRAVVAWRRHDSVGLRLRGRPQGAAARALRRRLRAPFYAAR